MPTHDYHCTGCEHQFEMTLPFGSPVPPCPECSAPETKRLISPPGVIFRGDGFYKTDSQQKPAPTQKEAQNGKEKPKSEDVNNAKSEPQKGDIDPKKGLA